jgi:hypothetical protein
MRSPAQQQIPVASIRFDSSSAAANPSATVGEKIKAWRRGEEGCSEDAREGEGCVTVDALLDAELLDHIYRNQNQSSLHANWFSFSVEPQVGYYVYLGCSS